MTKLDDAIEKMTEWLYWHRKALGKGETEYVTVAIDPKALGEIDYSEYRSALLKADPFVYIKKSEG